MIFSMRSGIKLIAAALCTALLVTGCQFFSLTGSENPAITLVQSQKARENSPNATDAELQALVDGNTDFALKLFGLLNGEPGNQFFSPLSISLALAMTYGGARGQTESEMAEALHFTLPQNRLHTALNALGLELAARNSSENFELEIANATWGARDYQFLASYLDLLAVNYGAAMRLLDFASDPERAREIINEWVKGRTNGKIEELLPGGTITPQTALVLTNAIYFNAKWETPFKKEATGDAPFTLLDGRPIEAPTMHEMLFVPYAKSDGLVAVELPYQGNNTSMLILMPERAQFAAFENSLTRERLTQILSNLQQTGLRLALPKFAFAAEYDLDPHLQALGMRAAFTDGQADFSGMDGSKNLVISDVLHKAFVAVDEEGTEAGAATAVVIRPTAAPSIEVRIDSPFIFAIRDRVTGTLLFVGRLINPLE